VYFIVHISHYDKGIKNLEGSFVISIIACLMLAGCAISDGRAQNLMLLLSFCLLALYPISSLL